MHIVDQRLKQVLLRCTNSSDVFGGIMSMSRNIRQFGTSCFGGARFYSSSSSPPTCPPKKTVLYDFHVKNGGKMVDFAGYLMPVQYESEGIAASHRHTRTHCSIFDVSHMLQTHVYGKDRIKFIESLTVADVQGLKDNQGTLSVFTNDKGGIIDDLIITKTDQDHLYIVTNAGCRHKDVPLMRNKEQKCKRDGLDVTLEFQEERGLIALQGPESAKFLQALSRASPIAKMPFMTTTVGNIGGVDGCRITRCGYTGEDGFEISIAGDKTEKVTSFFLELSAIHLAGLGARDSLRLEAGLCLYGNDIDDTTSPVEAGLAWTIGKRRRTAADFPGANVILSQLRSQPSRRRVGIISEGPPARAHTAVNIGGQKVGEVTSGCPAPSLSAGTNVAMAYVPAEHAKPDTQVELVVRNKTVSGKVVKMPFVKTKYFSG